jgi:DNA gyrase inhibitor GyrI
MLSRVRVDTTERPDTPVLFAASPGTPENIPAAAQRAWRDLEAAVEPRGRKAFGYWLPQEREYRACFSLQDTDDPDALGLGRTVLPGGHYRRARLKGETAYAEIGPAFDELVSDASIDESRPWLEFYRRHDEVDVLVPIRE